MSHSTRREFLRRAAHVGSALALPACRNSFAPGFAPGADSKDQTAFRHGVASGDPLPDRVILWTRVTPDLEGPALVRCRVAADPAMTDVRIDQQVIADAARDYTVKVDPAGLAPGTTYYYQFESGGAHSPVGRTRTAPAGSVDRLRVAVASCADYSGGFFNAYRAIAARSDLDLVLHLGDYIYENGNTDGVRPHEPPHELITLDDYRRRYAQYRLDADLQEAHRQHPFAVVWDDHEFANNASTEGAPDHDEALSGPWEARRQAAMQAYQEWLPIRMPDDNDPARIFRSLRYGELADFVMLDTRIYDRSPFGGRPAGAETGDADRDMIGPRQMAFLEQELTRPGVQWRCLSQQVVFGQIKVVGLPNAAGEGVYLNGDQWDGYRAERSRVLDLIEGRTVSNVVVLTGDVHGSLALEIARDPNNPLAYNPLTSAGSLAVEFVTTSVVSQPGSGLDGLVNTAAGALQASNPHIRYSDLEQRGYLLLDIDRDRVQGEWWYVDTTLEPNGGAESFGTAYRVRDGQARLEPVDTPTEPTAG